MKKVVYSYYCFDIIHIGHILDLKKSKEVAGENGTLIVGVLTDEAVMEKKPKPIIPFEERFEIALSLKYADKVVAQETYSPLDNLILLKPDVLMESTSHSQTSIDRLTSHMKSIGGSVVVNPYYDKQSSTKNKNFDKKISLK